MAGSGRISGVVRDASGRAVAGARAYIVAGPGAFPDIAALTDERGRFTLVAPVAGTYEVECSADGFAPARATVRVSGGHETQITISLTPR